MLNESYKFGKLLQAIANNMLIMRKLDAMIIDTAEKISPDEALQGLNFRSLMAKIPGLKALRKFAGGPSFGGILHSDVIDDLKVGLGTFKGGAMGVTIGIKLLKTCMEEVERTLKIMKKHIRKCTGKTRQGLPKGIEKHLRKQMRRNEGIESNLSKTVKEIRFGLAGEALAKRGIDFDNPTLDQFDFQREGLANIISNLLFVDL